MIPSQIRQLAFFYDVAIKDKDEEAFIHRLAFKEVTYELTDEEWEKLSRIFNKYAPDPKTDLEYIFGLIETLKEIEGCTFKFTNVRGEPVLDEFKREITGEF